MWQSLLLLLSILMGLSSVAMGAIIDHAFAVKMTALQLSSMATALRYHQMYAMLCIALAIMLHLGFHQMATNTAVSKKLSLSLTLFIVFTLVFSGSIYAINIFEVNSIRMLTPVGGMGLMIAWLSLISLCFVDKKST